MRDKFIIGSATFIVLAVILIGAMTLRWVSAKKPYTETVTGKADATWHDAKDPGADTTSTYFWQETYKVTYSRAHWPLIQKDKVFLRRQLMVQSASQ